MVVIYRTYSAGKSRADTVFYSPVRRFKLTIWAMGAVISWSPKSYICNHLLQKPAEHQHQTTPSCSLQASPGFVPLNTRVERYGERCAAQEALLGSLLWAGWGWQMSATLLCSELRAPFQRPVYWQALIGSDLKVFLSTCRRLMV